MLLCLGSAAAFGAMAVFGKLAYENGATVGTLLSVRFALAALVFWAICARRAARSRGARRGTRPGRPGHAASRGGRPGRPGHAAPARRDAVSALALGAVAYALQAGAFFAALTRMDAALVSLLVYTFPAMVAVTAVVMGRERADLRRFTALALASAGLVLVVGGAGALDALGVSLALGAAVVYTGYVLVGDGLTRRVEPVLLSALVCSGAAVTLTAGSALLGQLRPGELTAAGWGWLGALALLCTVAAIGLFLAGVRRVGPTTASTLSLAEPVVTALLAFAVFGDVLTAPQLLGGALVLASTALSRASADVKACSGGVA
jgi:drug/metabolite transporter (DMT)-like permease